MRNVHKLQYIKYLCRVAVMEKNTEIIYGDETISAIEIEQIGGTAGPLLELNDTLYRADDGRYFLKEERNTPLPKNAQYTMPRDRAWVEEQENRSTTVRELNEDQAMLWYVNSFLNDDQLRRLFKSVIARAYRSVKLPADRDITDALRITARAMRCSSNQSLSAAAGRWERRLAGELRNAGEELGNWLPARLRCESSSLSA